MVKQTLSIEQMKKLKNLGIDISKASMYLQYFKDAKNKVVQTELYVNNGIPPCITEGDTFDYVFTFQDILLLLPKQINISKETYRLALLTSIDDEFYFSYINWNYKSYVNSIHSSKDIIDAAYNILCWYYENYKKQGRKL